MKLILVKNGKVIDVYESVDGYSSSSEGELNFETANGPISFSGLKVDFYLTEEAVQIGDDFSVDQALPKENYWQMTDKEKVTSLETELSRKDTQIKNMQQVMNTILFEEGV